jgi:hypothetical protein
MQTLSTTTLPEGIGRGMGSIRGAEKGIKDRYSGIDLDGSAVNRPGVTSISETLSVSEGETLRPMEVAIFCP